MNPTTITARVTDQHLQLVNEALVASGGVDVLQIRFEFCGLWSGCGKTAVFYRNPEEVYHVPVTDNLVTVPWEMLTEEGHFYFGVFGVKSNRRVTEVVKVNVDQGALTTATATPEEPAPDIYEQIMAAYGRMERKVDDVRMYVGPGDMPEGYRLQLDPDGAVFEMDTGLNAESQNPVANAAITNAINGLEGQVKDNRKRIASNETAISEHKTYTANAGLGVAFYDNTPTSGKYISTLAEANALVKNGWYGLRRQEFTKEENIRDFGANFNYAAIHVVVVTSKDFYQYLYIHPNNNGQCVHRRYKTSTMDDWSPWEHIDPPMKIGVEYRTTERYFGNPVYVQLFAATMGDTSINTKLGTGTVRDVVDLKGMLYDGTDLATYKAWHPDFPLSYSMNSGTISLGETVPNYSNVYVTMKYTKS